MKRKNLILFGALISFLLLLTCVASAQVSRIQITTDPASQGRPEVHGDIIVWKDNRFSDASGWDIFAYRSDVGKEEPVTTAPGYQNVPVTNGSVAVWQDDREHNSLKNDIWIKSIFPEDAERPLVSAAGHQLLPAISGNTVVYVTEGPGGSGSETDSSNDIWAVDLVDMDGDGLLEGGQPYPVCTVAGSQWQPRISGTKVVWQDNRNGRWNIWAKDLASSAEPFPVTDETDSDNKVADIDGNLVVWQKTISGVIDIWMKDLSAGGGDAIAITNDPAYQNNPRVSGDLIVWENYDYQRANWDILMKDLTMDVVSALAETPDTEARPAIDRENVVWEAAGDAGYDIWMAHVPDTTPPQVNQLTPAPETRGCDSSVVSAGYLDNRAGIDTGAVRLVLDGVDVTEGSDVTEDSVTYRPPASLGEGTHSATISIADRSGNVSSSTWQFETNARQLRLSMMRGYWATYADYNKRELSVEFRLANDSPVIPVYDAEILAAMATGGAIGVSELPLYLGEINPQSSAELVLKYVIPAGAITFRTAMYIGLLDECGQHHFIPGPPAGS